MRKTTLFIIILTLFISLNAFAQDSGSFHKKGDTALCFGFNNYKVSTFLSGIGGKTWLSDRNALFISIYMNNRFSTNESIYDSETKNRKVANSFTAGYERHYQKSGSKVSPFWGYSITYRINK